MNVKYKIGDRVRLKKTSEYYPYQSNGEDGRIQSFDCEGYLERFPDGHHIDNGDNTYYFQIEWDNGNGNTYRIRDIEPAVSTVTRIPIPEVDMYVAVTDSNWPGVMYVQVTRGFSMESDGNLRGYGNLITFEKNLEFDSRVSIYSERNDRRFLPMSNREIVWMNYCLSSHSYTSYHSWKPSANDLLKIEVLDRYPNLKVGEEFGFVDGQEVKSIHPREWTVGSNYVYLAPSGEGGAMVYKNDTWFERRSKKITIVDPYKEDNEDVKENSFNVDDVVQATNTYSNAAFRIGEVFKVYDIEGEHIWINIGGSKRKEPAKYFKKIDLVGKKVRVMRDDIHSAGVKKDDILTIDEVVKLTIYTNKGWTFPISSINKPDMLMIIDDQKVEKVKVQIHDTSSSTTHLPYLNIGTKKKRTSFIEDVQPIKIKTSKQRVPNKLKIN